MSRCILDNAPLGVHGLDFPDGQEPPEIEGVKWYYIGDDVFSQRFKILKFVYIGKDFVGNFHYRQQEIR